MNLLAELAPWGLLVSAMILGVVADHQANYWRTRADYWMARAVKAEGGPSTVRDVSTQRAWRERRAVTSRDHTMRHSVEASCDSEAATEIMQLCVGPMEVEGGE